MQLEVDFLPVGNGQTSGDCITLRFGDLISGDRSLQRVIVIDGGFGETGEKLVSHLRTYYNPGFIDLVISTHPDRDHVTGLQALFEEFHVSVLLMHQPWNYSAGDDAASEADAARRAYEPAASLVELAQSGDRRTAIFEPFAGSGPIELFPGATMTVLGPSPAYYQQLLRSFEHNKDARTKMMEQQRIVRAGKEALKTLQETMDPSSETLDHVHKDTSAENNSSAIILFDLNGHKLLFTGDAGVPALHAAVDHAEALGISLRNIKLLDVPHHGSKHSVDSAFLDRVSASTAVISATAESKKHPSARVTNALIRRNAKVVSTSGQAIRHHSNAPARVGWGPTKSHEFVSAFEETD